ncbi:MAG: sigma-54 dependent transcriptional regulator [Succinivibrionaceae bacterium]|nr:sigma-54 dependent transcriptional regulator [Succinivibrionaceae bacterium]
MGSSRILVVDDDIRLREAITDTLVLSGYECLEAASGNEALAILQTKTVNMVISDIQMDGMDGHKLLVSIHEAYPKIPVLLMTAYANIDGAVKAMRNGAVDYLAKPFAPEVLLNQVSRYVPANVVEDHNPVCGDPKTKALLAMAAKVAATDATVMITGPSGAGKEVLSRYVHECSKRSKGPFVAINCAAIPETMLEATLFGYEKGAFTGAVQACPGKFEQAQGGTILLDEVTEIEPGLQAKLLRVLQEKEVERLGGRKTISLDIRVIATSNRDLKEAVSQGVFREDLYFRLNVFPLKWPPLCERPLDIVPIAQYLLRKIEQDQNLPPHTLTPEAMEALTAYRWPGNVRELDNVMQRALILAQDEITPSDLIFDDMSQDNEGSFLAEPPQKQILSQPHDSSNVSSGKFTSERSVFMGDEPQNEAGSPNNNQAMPNQGAVDIARSGLNGELKQQEYQIILDALAQFGGSRQKVAEQLGISPRTLRYKLAKMRENGYIIPGD